MLWLSAILLHATLAQADPIPLDSDLLTVDMIGQILRSKLGTSLLALSKANNKVDLGHGSVGLQSTDSSNKTVEKLRIVIERSLSSDKTSRTETVAIILPKNNWRLIEEEVVTHGTNLSFTNLEAKRYFTGSGNYGLQSGETKKIVTLKLEGLELFRAESESSKDSSGLVKNHSEISAAGLLVLKIDDAFTLDGSHRVVEYEPTPGQADFSAVEPLFSDIPGHAANYAPKLPYVRYRIDLRRTSPDHVVQDLYTESALSSSTASGTTARAGTLSEGQFSNDLSTGVMIPLFSNGLAGVISPVAQFHLPSAQTILNLGFSSNLYSDLKTLQSQVKNLLTNPSPGNIQVISSKIDDLLTALQSGTLVISNDTRPRSGQ